MAITLLCPNLKCRMVLAVPENTRGKKVRCRFCGTTFMVPPQPQGKKSPDPQAVAGKS